MNAIEIKNLSKSFRGMYAVDHLSMTVPVGAIYGFIGENGSGKSTTEKLICGLLVPDDARSSSSAEIIRTRVYVYVSGRSSRVQDASPARAYIKICACRQ